MTANGYKQLWMVIKTTTDCSLKQKINGYHHFSYYSVHLIYTGLWTSYERISRPETLAITAGFGYVNRVFSILNWFCYTRGSLPLARDYWLFKQNGDQELVRASRGARVLRIHFTLFVGKNLTLIYSAQFNDRHLHDGAVVGGSHSYGFIL